MTNKPTPKEIENLFVEETGFDIDDFPAAILDFASAVLAKWGQPAQAAEPVAWVPLTDGQIKALMQAHRSAMRMTCKARVPECGEFAAIAQDLDWLCESFGIKGGQHGTE